MNEFSSFSNKNIQMLLEKVAEKMGKTPEQLEKELKAGVYPQQEVENFMKNNSIQDAIKKSGIVGNSNEKG